MIVENLLPTLSLTLGLMTLLWLLSLALRDSSIVDVYWGAGFAVLAWTYRSLSTGFDARSLLLAVLVSIWGLRLAVHIFVRNAGKGEDFRYRAWREEHGSNWWWRSFFQVFMLQGILMWIVSLPLLAAMESGADGWTVLDIAGGLFWLVGFIFEAGGDWQLARFKSKPENKGKLLTSGFWSLTRHPNYFGDAAVWWGYFLFALPAGWWTIFSPAIMTFLLMRVSGVAMLERTMKVKPGYEKYMQNTPAFFPKISFGKNK